MNNVDNIKINNNYDILEILNNYISNILLKHSLLDLNYNIVLDEKLELIRINLFFLDDNKTLYLSHFLPLFCLDTKNKNNLAVIKKFENEIYLDFKEKLPNVFYDNKKYKLINYSILEDNILSLGLYLGQDLFPQKNITNSNIIIDKQDKHYIKLNITKNSQKDINNLIKIIKKNYTQLYLEILLGNSFDIIADLYYKLSKLILDESLNLKNLI